MPDFFFLDILIMSQGDDHFRDRTFDYGLCMNVFKSPVYVIRYLKGPNPVPAYLQAAQTAAIFNLPFQVKNPFIDSDGQMAGIPVPVDLINVFRHERAEGFCHQFCVIVGSNSFKHLLCGHKGQIFRKPAQ